ncbi:Alpha-N-acetylglucosamine transferase [Pyrenophora teres f. maculata]|nr:Alpha-N-acetylglucosamine transferase [Pyrenophora teres f. maculata]
MRRRHNITLTTLVCLGTIYVVAQHRHDIQGVYETHSLYTNIPNENGIEVLPSDLKPNAQAGGGFHVSGNDISNQASPNDLSLPIGDTPLPVTGVPAEKPKQDPFSSKGGLSIGSDSIQASTEREFPFQQDLDLELPTAILHPFKSYRPHNYKTNPSAKYAYATFLVTRNPSLKDPYFLAIHSLIYRLLWSPKSGTRTYPFIVFVAGFVTSEQRALLSGAGAVVRELAPLEWSPNVPGVQKRWKDLFAKLNMWKETEFERILFLDADAFPLANLDQMFDLAPVRDCVPEKLHLDDFLTDGPVCESYIFADVPQDHVGPVPSNLNVGSMVFTPSLRMHARLLQNYVKTDKYDSLMAEQAFLNWQFSPEGAYPGTPLERTWGGFFPTEEDGDGRLKVVHEKIWVAESGWLKDEWKSGWRNMMGFYGSESFRAARELDGVGNGAM